MGHRGNHPGQVRSAAGAGDDYLEPFVGGALGERRQPVGRCAETIRAS
jgi:hypothetical protein